MTKPTPPPTFNKLFEDGDFYITDEAVADVSYERNSVIIHPCPRDMEDPQLGAAAMPFNITIIMPDGVCEECYYCGQEPSDTLVTIYKLHNWDCFASDHRDTIPLFGPSAFTRKYSSRIM